jgi:hypothetical protein
MGNLNNFFVQRFISFIVLMNLGYGIIIAQNVLPAATYCSTDPPQNFYIGNPGDKTWTTSIGPAVIQNNDNGNATFYPALVPGPYPRVITILYQNPNYTGEPAAAYNVGNAIYSFTVTISTPPVVTFAAIPNVCQTDAAFNLAPRGNPVGGTYAGPGVDAAGWFSPSVAGPGSHSLSYTYPAAGCSSIAYQFVTVQAIPVVTLPAYTPVCIDAAPFALNTGSPAGGTYTVDGVPAVTFDPGAAGVGNHTVTYTYTSGLCSNSASQTLTVNALPVVSLGGLLAQQCNTQPAYIVTGTPTNAFGSFTGSGITDNNNGTAVFTPGSAGLGLHDITYYYTDANGCSNSVMQTTRVGTMIYMNGLASDYCSGDPVVSFTYSPFSANPANDVVSGPGVTDLEGGNATFSPAVAGLGTKTITYSFTDDIGCVNIVTKNVVVYETPDANYSGLSPSLKYCYGAADVSLTGTYSGGIFTGPPGSILDNGNGTAVFKPSVLTAGIYTITYSYTNASGCTDNKSYNVEILSLPAAFPVTGGGSRCEVLAGLPVGLTGSVAGVNYKLYRDGVAVVPDNTVAGTGAAISFGNQTIAGAYTVIATTVATGCINQMTGSAVITVLPQLAITLQPVSTTICEDGAASFTVEATGQNRSYQWYNDGVAVGFNSNVLVLNPVPFTDDGNLVYCVVSSTCGGPLESNKVLLNVNPNNKILTNPVSVIKCTGSSASFTIVAEGLNPVYQWKKEGVNVVNVAGKIAGANTSALSIFNLAAADAGLYSCEVTGDCGSAAVSTQATLTVNDPIVITAQPSNSTACTGSNTTFSLVATPAAGLTYQWYFDADGAGPGVPIPLGANSPSHPINGVVAGNAGTYYCRISSACGQVVNSNQVILTVPVTTSITVDPVGDMVCEGTTLNLSVTAVGDALTYEWYKDADPAPLVNGPVVQNASTSTLTLSGLTQAFEGNYRVKITGTCGIETSAPDAAVTVMQPVTITSQPVSITRCSGSDATFSVVTTGDVLQYQWQFNNVNIPLANNADYTVTGATIVNAGNYRCIITTSECGTVQSSQATLIINPVTAITAHPTPLKNVCAGSNTSFSVTATGVGLTYQWYKNLVSMGAAYQTQTLSLNNVTAADAASYTCQITGTCGGMQVSTPGVLTVDIPIVISAHPQSNSVCLNASHDINVVLANGTNPSYQWYFDNGGGFVPLGGATTQVLDLTPFTALEDGDYYCVVSNGCGSVNSQIATLTLIDAFNITSGIADASVCENGSKTYTITADQPVSFRWMKNGIDIPGATTATLILNNIPFADNGAVYSCEVYNNCKSQIVSSTLTVSKQLSITTQPQNGIACPLAPYSINIVVSGTNPQYQWYKTPAALLAGQTASSLSFAAFAPGDAGTYYCIVTNGCGSVTSNNAVITAGIITTVTNPGPLTFCTGNDATFTVNATGNNLTYSWRKNYIPLVDDGRIVGSLTNTLTINDIVAGDEETYDVIVTGTCGLPATSAGAFLDVRVPPVITDQPDPVTICSGQNASFRVVVPVIPSDPVPTYQWQLNNVPINTVLNPSAATPTLNLVGAVTGGIYNCVITKAFCGSVTSTSAELIIEQNINITGQPAASQTKCQGTNVSFTATLTGPTDMTLQWYKDDGTPTGVPVANGARISGATLPTLSINNIVAGDAGSYFLRATGSCGTSVTNSAALIVQERIAITQQPNSITVCPGGTLTLNVIASGTVTNYTWKLGAAVVGAGLTYSVSPFVAGVHDGNYTVELTNICETVISDIAVVTAGIPTTASVSADVTNCEGGNASFTITATGSNLTYQWYKGATMLSDNARIGGSNTAVLTISGLIPSDAATYQCDVSGSCGFDNDNSAVLTVNENITITIQPASTSALVGTNPTFTVVAAGGITSYQWQKAGAPIADGALYSGTTTPTLTILDAQAADAGSYNCVITGICENRTSNTATLTVIPASGIVTQPLTPVSVCETSNFSINIVATAGAHTYLWRKDGVPLADGARISGSTTSVLSVTGIITTDAGAYTCLLDGSEISSASVVTVKPTTNITVHPAGGTKCVGDMHIFSVTAAGANLTYQWYKNNLSFPIGGATTFEYTINPLAVGDNGTYFCVVTGDCGQKTSNPAALTVNIPISVVAQPAPSTPLCQGNSASLFFNVTGTNLTYVWNKNGQPITDVNITGVNTNTLIITSSIVSNTGSYTCTVSGLCSTPVTSNTATVTVNAITAISTQPISRTKCEGEAVTFAVAASGTNLHYTWRLNGAPIAGAPDNPVYTIPVLVKATHEGNYTCVITGDCGPAVTSETAVLTVYRNTSIGAPVISAGTICQNGTTNISVTATGDNLTYLWKKDGLAITSGNVTGITTNTLVISNAATTDAGVYTCTVTGACGSPQTSTSAVITVNPTTVITTQPSNYTKCAGDEVIFTVEASGAGLAYQWKKGGAAGVNVTDGLQGSGATITGASTSQMKISGTTISEAGSYACVITGTCGNVNSNPANLTVNIPIQITVQPPVLTSVCQGASTEINVTITGTATLYRWKKGSVYLTNGGSISGVNTSKLVVSNAVPSDAGFYSCEISGSCNTVNSLSSELVVNPLPSFTVNPSGATLCEGENIQLMVMATGAAPLGYQWQFNAVNILGATSSTLTLNSLTPANSGAYTCIVTAAVCGTATSTPAVLTVNPVVDISIQPVNTNVCEGTTAIFSVTASGTAPVSYQWKYNNVNIVNGGRISGATSNELRISLANDTDEGIYKCEIASGCGSETSSSAILTVDAATSINLQPLNQTIVQGTNAVFSISATGVITGYQWQRNGVNITDGVKYSGTGTPILTVLNVAVTDAASYRCIVTGTCGTQTSNLGVLTVVVPVTTTDPISLTKCTTESASFSVVASGTITSYQWIFNGANLADGGVVSGSQTPNLVISSVTAAHEGNYACVVTGTYNVAISDVATLTVNDPPVITLHPVTQTLCINDWLILEVTATGDNLSYEWERNGVPVVPDANTTGINTSLLVITNVTPVYAGIYRCRVSNSCQTRWSNDAVVTINPAMTLLTNPAGSTKCVGQTTTFSVTTSGVGVLYQWYKGGVAVANTIRITGAQTRNLTITGIEAGDADSYSCVVTDNCNSINSTTAVLTVRENVVISSQPSNQTVCEGQNAFFNVSATGYNLTYTWQKNGAPITDVNITGINTSTLVITNATIANAGVYRCFLDGDCNDILTGTANLTVNALPAAAGAVTGSTTICQGTKGVLYTVPAIANASSYVWTLPYNATIVSGAGTRSITVDFLAGSLSGVVSVHGVNGCSDGPESAPLAVTVNAMPVAVAGPDQVLCTDATLFAATPPPFGAGTWTKLSGQGLIDTPSSPTSALSGIGQGENIFMWSVSQAGCTSRDTVRIYNRRVFVDAGIDQIVCSFTSTLNANNPTSGSGSWSIINGGGSFNDMTNPKASIINLSRGNNTLRWSINNGGCISFDEMIIRNDLPTNADAGKDTILIVDNYTLAGNNPAIGTGQWTLLSGSATITNLNQFNTTVTGLGIGENVFEWTITNNLCYNKDQVKVINYTPTKLQGSV